MVKIQTGSFDEFFDSALQTAKEIDNHQKVTSKKTIWVDENDLINILRLSKLLKYLKEKKELDFENLSDKFQNIDENLELLSKYELITILNKNNHKIIKSLYNEPIEFKTTI